MTNSFSDRTPITLLRLDSTIYSLEAIQRVVYEWSKREIFLLEKDGIFILINYYPKTLKDYPDKRAFLKDLMDHQLRLNIERQYSQIRETLVSQAIQSCTKSSNLPR